MQGQQHAGDLQTSPEAVAHLSQSRLVPLLAACAQGRGCQLQYGTALSSFSQQGDRVELRLQGQVG